MSHLPPLKFKQTIENNNFLRFSLSKSNWSKTPFWLLALHILKHADKIFPKRRIKNGGLN